MFVHFVWGVLCSMLNAIALSSHRTCERIPKIEIYN